MLLRRVAGLFERYAQAHAVTRGRCGPIRDARGREIGRIRDLVLDAERIRVTGHADAARIALRVDGRETVARRPEGLDGPQSFDLVLPRPADGKEADPRPHAVLVTDDGPEQPLRFPPPAVVRTGLYAGFGLGLLRLTPALLGWSLTGAPHHRQAVKRVLGLQAQTQFGPVDPGILETSSAPIEPAVEGAPVTVLLPVHNGFDLVGPCLDRLRRNTVGPWRLVVIEDGSTDPRIRPFLRDWTAEARAGGVEVELIEPSENLGFIGAVNAGLERILPAPGPVVLLNSDAFVPAGWDLRLLAPLADPQVASVTPMSNDSEITTVPAICVRGDLPEGAAEAIDAVARRFDPRTEIAEMPTGVGFCMALSARFLELLPRLDTAFGKGYGEEVDWCQRARALGGRHVGTGALFVEHRGGASFGSEQKAALIARNNALISRRYPAYDGEVQQFLRRDPLRGPRLALALAWADAVSGAQGVPVYLAHSLGGGAEIWLARRIAEDLAEGRPSVVLRVGGPARWQLELHAPGGVTGAVFEDAAPIERLLGLLGRRRIVYSCGVGDPDPISLPRLLLKLRAPGDELQVLLHDWLPISPSYTLLDADLAYRGPVGPDRADPAHAIRRPDGRRATLRDWQAEWGALMRAADRIVLFSETGRAQLRAAWPDLDPARIALRPHRMPPLDGFAVAARPAPARPVIGVIGNVNRHKGTGVLAALGREIGAEIGGVVILGRVDPACPMPRRVTVHGGYEVAQIPALVERYRITHWLVPAIWPETFSFATHEALATGLPVLAFDIGAQGAAVRAAPNGRVVPFSPGGELAQAVLAALREDGARPATQAGPTRTRKETGHAH